MKSIKLLLSFFIVFSFLIIFPKNVNAKSYESDYIEVNSSNNTKFETDEFEFSLNYDSGVGADALGIFGDFKGKDPSFYYYHYIFTFFDSSYQKLFEINGHGWTQDILTNPNGVRMSDYFLHKDYLDVDYLPYNTTSPVKYYKLYIEPSTYKNADEYIVAKNKKDKIDQYYPKIDKDTSLLESNTIVKTNSEYEISKYIIDIVVNDNNTFNIKEDITTNFFIDKHGILRKLPLRNVIKRLDGTTSKNNAKVSEIEVNDNYSVYKENNYKVIKIGDPFKTIKGSKNYVINYLYDIGKDPVKEYDELYFNIVGNEWDTSISNLEFNITMPKEFDKTKVGFSSGYVGSTDSTKIEYSIDGNVISGKYNGILKSGEALTIRLELPEGYFTSNFNYMILLMFLLPIIFALISFILWFIYGKDNKVVETVEFYPPEDFNSVEVGFLYKGKSNVKDIVSLLIYLANKGFIKIEEIEEKSLFSSAKGFKLIKLKNYSGNKIEEQIFFDNLFKDSKDEVVALDLYNEFYKTTNKILKIINSKENKNKIFEKSSWIKSLIVLIMIILSLITIFSIPTLEYNGIAEVLSTLFVVLFYVPFYSVIFQKKIPVFFRTMWGVFTIFHSSIIISSLPIREAILSDTTLLFGFLTGLLCIGFMIFILKIMPKRTPYGNEMLGKIKGFRRFLETAEKSNLEELVMKDPYYFFNILPYTYVLGISDKWIKKFESINMQSPEWYSGSGTFSTSSFGSFMSSTMSSASDAMSSSPSSGSSGGSGGDSGGGSSGGGSGGGGGGSW